MDDILDVNERPETILSHQPKRRGASHGGSLGPRHDWYMVGWICALHIEMAAARAMLDEVHDPLPQQTDDSNTYVLGSIKQHNVVVACLPHGQYGTNNAAIVATNMLRTFPGIRVCLMVGIGGGVPSRADLRLGDIVVGTRVMQCDLGKYIDDGHLLRTAIPRIPRQSLGTAVSALRSKHELSPSRVPTILQQMLGCQPAYSRPSIPDRLFHATYNGGPMPHDCDGCDQSKLVKRSGRVGNEIMIHYGAIASGNQVMRSGMFRDDVARKLDVICFEMETASLLDILPCLPIRGICDYSDSHKSKEWQRYAAATAAAYAREFLEELPRTESHVNITYCRFSDERRQSLLNSLKFEQIDYRKINIKDAHSKTCQWLFSHSSYGEWLDPAALMQHHGFLWINGKPGAGKSTIMKVAYERMKRIARARNSVTASFFFNARGEYLEKSITGMYRSLLLQVLEGYPDLQTVLDDLELVPQSLNSCPPLNSLKGLFLKAVSALGQRELTCFVDALDECDEQQVVDMVQFFEDLAGQFSAKGVPFRICFSSRHYPYIALRRGIRLTLEDQPGHAKDLETYVGSRLRIRDQSIAEELQFTLLDKAAGVFMWVVLVVGILNQEDRRGGMSLRKRLAEIPSDLSELFRDILRRDCEDTEALLLCILWILYAERPLQPKEFYHALWSGLSFSGLADSQAPDVTVSDSSDGLSRFDRYVIHSSKGLAEVTKSKKPTVQFIHESVRDFLIKDKGLCELWPESALDHESLGHERLKQCCLFYLNHTSVVASVDKLLSVPNSNRSVGILTKLPFLEYAGQHALYHANIAAKRFPQREFLLSLRFSNWIKIHNAFEKFKVRRYTEGVSLMYVLADNGHSELVRIWPKEERQEYTPRERYKYPLFAALANGNKETIAAILDLPSCIYNGIDLTDGLNNRKDVKGYENRTPLSWAAQEGRDTLVQLLLHNGVAIDQIDQAGLTALSRATQNGHDTIIKLLIENGADVNASPKGWTPLHWASARGHEAIARLLSENGADVNAGDNNDWTPLQAAPNNGYERLVALLIDKGGDVNAGNKSGWTPLLRALVRGCYWVAKVLIDSGANVNAHDRDGWTLLFRSSNAGKKAVAELLIEKGADVNISDIGTGMDGQPGFKKWL
ncbi:hypothetical protein BDV37DRAFT_288928 [Aspergillus pseudonomiae]|uniref:Nucleoside phosphorylase domain-containing protein n=1 Tax=Aspergillus pseudonomiae TaxID=1506151 RepID=A0A5N7CUY2_9EURO|nr:uncharacterized protein BDV37DRAFT_288928 [Aspergillus pseudonomiae]KAE8398016.1 hypothetical protein BDV37DRAFT_288928 [Aspergillus pseudonomiae]